MKALVTGGGGYLGRHIAAQLLARGDEVWVLGRRRYPAVEALGAQGVVCDLGRDDPALTEAVRGMAVVFHAAALPPNWGTRETFWATNVEGTERVIAACREAGVPRLVYTGSPSCTFDGGDADGVTEQDCPYPEVFEGPYPETKAAAEQRVLAANGAGLSTTSLRPHLIYGPEEPHMLPRIIQRNRSGRLPIIGDGSNRVGLTFIDNAAAAHIQAADALGEGSPNAGRAYFVTDPEPVRLWDWLNQLLVDLGEPRIQRSVSLATARRLGRVLELLWTWLPLPGDPPMTRFVASALATTHWYDLAAARADFGLTAAVSSEEAMVRTVDWFRENPV